MSLKIITVGDSTDHGGTVITGSPTHDIGGKAIARLNDKVFCQQLYPGGAPHGVNKIITAHETLTVGDIPVAVEGSKTECGCTLIGTASAAVDYVDEADHKQFLGKVKVPRSLVIIRRINICRAY